MTKTFCDRCGKELPNPAQRTFAIEGQFGLRIEPLRFARPEWTKEAHYCRACLCDIIKEDRCHE